MNEGILVINAGSSSIKFSLFELKAATGFALQVKGQVEEIGTQPHFIAKTAGRLV